MNGFLIAYLVSVPITFMWIVGVLHEFEASNHSSLWSAEPDDLFWSSCALISILSVFSAFAVPIQFGWRWTWPRRGVTYDVETRP